MISSPGSRHQGDAKQFLRDLRERFAKFNLELHPDKTRLIEFGRFAAERRAKRGSGKPETFDFLGFTHICGKTRDGQHLSGVSRSRNGCGRSSKRSKPTASNAGICPSRAGAMVGKRGTRPSRLLRRASQQPGGQRPSGIQATRHWCAALRRRSQRHRLNWERMNRLATRWLPPARILHPYPDLRFDARTRGRSPVR